MTLITHFARYDFALTLLLTFPLFIYWSIACLQHTYAYFLLIYLRFCHISLYDITRGNLSKTFTNISWLLLLWYKILSFSSLVGLALYYFPSYPSVLFPSNSDITPLLLLFCLHALRVFSLCDCVDGVWRPKIHDLNLAWAVWLQRTGFGN